MMLLAGSNKKNGAIIWQLIYAYFSVHKTSEITKCKCFLLDLKMQDVKRVSKRYVCAYINA